MKFLVISDLHFYRNVKKSLPTENGLTTWCSKQIEVFESVCDYAIENNIQTVFVNGDVFEEKNNINQTLYNAVWETFKKYSEDITFYINIGNHDTLTIANNSSLIPFSSICNVITKPYDVKNDEGSLIRLIPYGQVTEESLKIPKGTKFKKKILFTHEHIDGLKWNTHEYWKPSDLKKSLFQEWDIVFNGHIHMHQELGNIINVGSMMQQDFGEMNEDKVFIEYDNGKITIHIIETGIKHLYYANPTEKEIKSISRNNVDMIKVLIPTSLMEEPWVKKYNIFPVYEKPKTRETRIEKKQSIEEDIQAWVTLNNTDLDYDRLISLGIELTKK